MFYKNPRIGRYLLFGRTHVHDEHHIPEYTIFAVTHHNHCHSTVSKHLNITTRQQQHPTILLPQMSSPGGPRRSSSRGSSPFFSACTGKSLENKVRWWCGKSKKKSTTMGAKRPTKQSSVGCTSGGHILSEHASSCSHTFLSLGNGPVSEVIVSLVPVPQDYLVVVVLDRRTE